MDSLASVDDFPPSKIRRALQPLGAMLFLASVSRNTKTFSYRSVEIPHDSNIQFTLLLEHSDILIFVDEPFLLKLKAAPNSPPESELTTETPRSQFSISGNITKLYLPISITRLGLAVASLNSLLT